jgi:hypothetical protein
MVIDCHCHAGPGDGLTGPWDTDAPLRLHVPRARAAGIDRTVLFAAFHSDYRLANRIVGQIVLSHPRLFDGFAFVHSERDRGRIRDLVAEAVGEFGFRGIKVHRHDARISREVCHVAREFRLPVLYDVMGEVSTIDLIAPQYPEVDFIIPHLGSFADDWRAQRALLDPLSRLPNVFADTSGVRRFDLLEEACRRAGPHKILFGSDGPWLHPGVELAKVRLLGLPRAALQQILGGNWQRLTAKRRQSAAVPHVAAAQPRQTAAHVTQREVPDPWQPRVLPAVPSL